ncbi:hypothetical protein [Rhizobacter sp. Root16D2]|uniref:hypothetical protein n=1 Tax=Rhizobacter sp. Root16D2 TaxID=1736479 RepID=UPI0006F57F01|nr:hypothetical protein [Rhizobacter sp. Root16D2]KRB24774.1 hypothetical protein ASE08_00815 [Rhizobacter sp. Root16D2]
MVLTITFVKTGTNAEGALTGELKLLDGGNVIRQSIAFSGGNSFNPLDDGQYKLHLDIRGDASTNKVRNDGTLEPFYGIQKVGTSVQAPNGKIFDMQVEWGSIRARLNPTGGAPDKGEYIHGKTRVRDYTHGCICDRTEAILAYLWDLKNPPATIDVSVSGGKAFDLEALVRKNLGEPLKGA